MSHRVLLVGLGAVAMGYDLAADDNLCLTHARAFQRHSKFVLVGGVDPDAERRRLFSEHYCPTVTDDLVDALVSTRPDVVVIAVPTPQHSSIMQDILQHASPRVILCEKPLAYEVSEARLMVEACRHQQCALFVNYLRRVEPGVLEIKRMLDQGEMAGPVKGVAWYSKGLMHNGSHFFNVLEFWLGPCERFKVINPGRWWEGTDPEPDVYVGFRDGDVTFLAANEENFSHHEVQLVARNGCLRYEQGGARIKWQPTMPDKSVPSYTVLSDESVEITSEGHRLMLHVADQVAAFLAGSGTSLCSGEDALLTLESLLEIKEAL